MSAIDGVLKPTLCRGKKLHLYLSADCRCTADDVIDINIIEDLLTKWCQLKKQT
jgi:hypothetical protein